MPSVTRSVQPTDEIVLTPDHAATPERPKPAGTPARAAAGPGSVQPTAKRPTGKRRTDKTAEELLEELGADELTIANSAPTDELSESGVRHLSVSVVNRRSPLARLFDRVARKRAP